MIDWRALEIRYLRWRARRLEAQIQKLEEEVQKLEEEWAELKGGDDVAY